MKLWTAVLRVHYQSHDSWTQTCLFSVALVSANRKLFMFVSHTLQASFLKYIHESLEVNGDELYDRKRPQEVDPLLTIKNVRSWA